MRHVGISIFLLHSGLALLPVPASASDRALGLRKATDIVGQWRPGQHLYLRGRLGVNSARLDALESWLDRNAPNWTVLLLENARGETWRDADGRSYSGMEAVEYAVGKGLANKTGFGDLTDARTGGKNGAAFVLFLRERKFSYVGSETHNQRNLGAANWNGRLDRPAFRAMSNGGRIVDAVQNTVKEIEARLTRQLALEQQQRQRDILLAQQRKADAGQSISEARRELASLQARIASLREQHPGHTGDLLQPDFDSVGRLLGGAGLLLNAGDAAEAARSAERVRDWIRGQGQLVDTFLAATGEFDRLHSEIAELNPTGRGWGAERLEIASEELGKAQDAHARGDAVYVQHFQNARQAADSAYSEIERAKRELEREVVQQREIDRRARIRTQRFRNGAIGAGGVGLLGLAGGGVFLNRRRRTWKREAEELLESWERGFAQKTDALFELLDRTAVVIGSEADLPKRGYTGETLALSRQTIEAIDELFIMSSAVERVLRDAREQIHPKYGVQRGLNLFSTQRYLRAMKLLRDEPIRFAPEEGIELIVREDAAEHRDLLGRVEAYRAFALSFNELVAEFNGRAALAMGNLDVIERSWSEISGALEEGQRALTEAAQLGNEVAEKAEEDGILDVPSYAGAWLVAAETLMEAAVNLSGGDPVQALRDPVAKSRRMTLEMGELARLILEARKTRFPGMRGDVKALEEAGHQGGWVDVRLRELSATADAICERGSERSVDDEIREFADAFAGLDTRVGKATDLAASLRETEDRQLDAVEESVESTRKSLAGILGVNPETVLAEEGLNPDTRLAEGRAQHRAARAAIDRGSVEDAEAALEAVGVLAEDALGLIAVTRKSHEEHATKVQSHKERAGSLNGQHEECGELLQRLQSSYAEAALWLDASETSEGNESSSVSGHVSLSGDAQAEARQLVERSEAAAAKARFIEAAGLLEQAAEAHNRCDMLLSELREQKRRLAESESRNDERFVEMGREENSVRTVVQDPRVMRGTKEDFETAKQSLESARAAMGERLNDPFAIARQLTEVDGKLDDVRQRAASDAKLFDEAKRSVHELETHVATAHQLAHRAATDEIADSQRLLELQETVEQLKLALAKCEKVLRIPHEDWKALDIEADRIGAIAGRVVGEMRGELRQAQAAVAQISSASGLVRDATGWRGDYGVRIPGSPGAEYLHEARMALMRGMYLEAQRHARDAAESARHALRKAHRAVANRRAAAMRAAEERRRAERARRRRMRRSSSSSFGSGIGSRSRSGGSSFGGGGMGRSSFSSGRSGSGMSRSGW